jgi:hypothetical protein
MSATLSCDHRIIDGILCRCLFSEHLQTVPKNYFPKLLCFSSKKTVMLSTKHPSSRTGQTRLPPRIAPRAPLHASCFVPPPAPCASRRALLSPHARCNPPHLVPPAWTHVAYSRSLTSAPWHRAPCRRQASCQ